MLILIKYKKNEYNIFYNYLLFLIYLYKIKIIYIFFIKKIIFLD